MPISSRTPFQWEQPHIPGVALLTEAARAQPQRVDEACKAGGPRSVLRRKDTGITDNFSAGALKIP